MTRPSAYATLSPAEARPLTEAVDLRVDGIPDYVLGTDGIAIEFFDGRIGGPNYGRIKLTVHEAEHLVGLINDTMAGLRAGRKDQS